MSNTENNIVVYKVDYSNSYVEGYIDYLIGRYENGILVDSKTYRLPEDTNIDEFIKELNK